MNIALETQVRQRPNLHVRDESINARIDAYTLQPTREEIIQALLQSIEGWDGPEAQEAGVIWSIKCHLLAIKVIQEMKEEP